MKPQAGNLSSKYAIHNLVQPLSTSAAAAPPTPGTSGGGGGRGHGTGTRPAKSHPNPPGEGGQRGQLIYLPVLNPHTSATNTLTKNQNVMTVKFLLATAYEH